jgi:stress-induced morphogen
MWTAETIRSQILARFSDADVEVEDLTGSGDHFRALVTSRDFEGKTMLEQHRMVYAALDGLHSGSIHALGLRTRIAPRADRGESDHE